MNKIFLTALATIPVAAIGADNRPNILVILADDLGFSDLGCFGGEIETPTLNNLSQEGVRLTQLYNSARSCPSRASLVTGLYPHQVGVGGMTLMRPIDPKKPVGYAGFREDNNVTTAELLKESGYYTAMVGKWHLGIQKPTDRGFDDYFGLIGGFNSMWNKSVYSRLPAGAKELPVEGRFYATNVFTDYAIDFAKRSQELDKPLFMYLAYNAPHFPLHAPKEMIDKYMDRYMVGWDRLRDERYKRIMEMELLQGNPALSPRGEVPGSAFVKEPHPLPAWDDLNIDQQRDLARRMATFAAMVDIMDSSIGKILSALDEMGELENTIIMFMSDNGACAEWHEFGFDGKTGVEYKTHIGDELDKMGQPASYMHYGTGWANVGVTPFSLYKHYTYEGGISTPCIMWSGDMKKKVKGSINHSPCHFNDIMATCLDIAGVDYPEEFKDRKLEPTEGVTLMPALSGKPIEQRVIYAEHENNKMVRDGKWKAVSIAYTGGKWELFNIEEDRTEQNNLAKQYPEKIEQMSKLYNEWAERCHVKR